MLAGQGIFLPRNPLQSGLPRSSEPRGSRKYSHAPRKTVQTPPSTLNGGCNGASELGGGQSSSLTSARLASFYPNPPALPLNHSSSSHHDIEQGSHRFELPCRSAIKEDQGAHTPDDVQDARAPLRSTERLVHYLISDQTPVSGHNQHLSSRPAFGATLQEKADAARRAQNGWLERNFYEASQIANLRQAHLQAIKAKREELAEVDRQSKREIQEQRLQDLQRRAAAATERRAWEAQERRKEEADASAARRALIEQRDAERRRQAEEAEELRRERELANQARITAEAERRRLEFEEHLRAEAELAALLVAQIEAEEEARRREAEEAERRRRERERECAVCLERHDLGVMVEAPCAHWYCRGHLREALEAAYISRTPFQCCQQPVSIHLLTGHISTEFRVRYDLLVLELSTINPVYCSSRACAAFIPPSQTSGPDLMQCPRCAVFTCRHCRQRDHGGRECVADVGTQQARSLAAAQGWKACPSCTNMVEKSSGCLHMTCRCGTEFCYRCGDLYRLCRSTCHRR